MRVNVYIDGFNLYYGGVRNTKYKWLNLRLLCEKITPKREIRQIKYFTAKIKNTKSDPSKVARQMIYWRALRTIESLEIIEGHYSTQKKLMPLVNRRRRKPMIEVWKNEEKRSDVNLAVHLVSDGYEKLYDTALIITNDYDIEGAIRLVVEKLGVNVVIARPPNHPYPSKGLRDMATLYSKVSVVDMRNWMFQPSLFPIEVASRSGVISCPMEWR